jgi:hypothetical protein
MKKFYIIAIVSFIFTTGCFDFDIVHYIEPKKDKSLFIKFRVTSIYFKEKENNNLQNNEIIKSNLPDDKNSKVTYQTIQNDLTAGIEITIEAKPYSAIPSDFDKFPIIPYKDKYGQYVLIFHNYQKFSSSNEAFESQKIAEGLLAASKYRLAFGNTIPKKALIIVNRNQPERFNLAIYKIGNVYCIDIPMNLILINESAVIVSCDTTIKDSEISNYFATLLEKRKEEEKKQQEELNKNENNDTNKYNNDDGQEDNKLENDYNDEQDNTDSETGINKDEIEQ